MWSALDWELLKPWGCSFVEAVVTATAPWEDQWCSRSKQLLEKAFVDVTMKKVWCSFRPWFSSELWHFLVVNKTTKNAWNRNSNGCDVAHMFGHPWKMYIYHFSARINVKFIRADIAIFTDRTIWEKSMKHCKTQCEINMFHIHTNKMQLASGEPPAFTLYIYTVSHINIIYIYIDLYIYSYIYNYIYNVQKRVKGEVMRTSPRTFNMNRVTKRRNCAGPTKRRASARQ